MIKNSKVKIKELTLESQQRYTIRQLSDGISKTVYLVKIIFLTDVKLAPSTPAASILYK